MKKLSEAALGDSPVLESVSAKEARKQHDPTTRVKLIAFYLPQFHPIKENDDFWGKGFTEWTNVTRAKPQFQGHYQPQLPGELGFYDLRIPETLSLQARLAHQYGIFGFCFYYYWFSGRCLLERPLKNMLMLSEPSFPFCICWANENWTRNWDGANEKLLVRQDYSGEFADEFIHDVIPIMQDSRYIRMNGKPMLLVYRVDQLPNPHSVARRWRQRCIDAGLGSPHLCAVQSFGIGDPREYGFDAAVEFPPHTRRAGISPNSLSGLHPDFRGYIEDYRMIVKMQTALKWPDYSLYRGVMPAWDNTPRRGDRSRIVAHSSSELYELWLSEMVRQTVERATGESAVFINAWNEWAEGAYIEPDQRFGRARLIATRAALDRGVGGNISG
jgi:lipopolysaccharide biosynthesis protein